jgi:hypothetical protein
VGVGAGPRLWCPPINPYPLSRREFFPGMDEGTCSGSIPWGLPVHLLMYGPLARRGDRTKEGEEN